MHAFGKKISIRKGMQLISATTHHAVHVAVHGRRAPPRTDDKLAWAEPSPGRHRAEAKYALTAKFLDAELVLGCPTRGAARGAPGNRRPGSRQRTGEGIAQVCRHGRVARRGGARSASSR